MHKITKITLILVTGLLVVLPGFSQKIVFLHHSTGAGVYNDGKVASWISTYNKTNNKNYQISELSYPNTPYPWANYAYDYWNLWLNGQCSKTNTNILCMDELTKLYDVIIFKHCYPGAAVVAEDGKPLVSSSKQTLANYKLQYAALRGLMDQYPDKKFIVWTLAPLHRNATDAASATRAKTFVDWVKNQWLTEDGKSHKNISVFDFFGLAAELNSNPANGRVNCLKYDYEGDHNGSDSHPNALANKTIGPVFAQFIVNTIENVTTGMYLNEFADLPVFRYISSYDKIGISNAEGLTCTEIFNLSGEKIFRHSGPLSNIQVSGWQKGIYIVRFQTVDRIACHKLAIQ